MAECKIALIGVGQRGYGYIGTITKYAPAAKITALCDTSAERLDEFAATAGLDVPKFYKLDDLIAHGDFNVAIITVPDPFHCEVAVACLKAGKHIMLEKPMALNAADCRKIIATAQEYNRIIQVGFVLRFHPLYRAVREIVASGELGNILNISASECLGVMHGASYMRRWHRKSANSGSFMLAKCSHDIDILSAVAGARISRVASFGSCRFFTPDKLKHNFCSECPDTSCRFRFGGEMVQMTAQEKAAPSAKKFDLCVYNDDKDLVDHQITLMEFENGIKCDFTLNLFAPVAKRTIAVFGTNGYLHGDTATQEILLTYSDGRPARTVSCAETNASGHGGSDLDFLLEFVHCVETGSKPEADLMAGLASTVAGVAIEQARLSGQVINIKPEDYRLSE